MPINLTGGITGIPLRLGLDDSLAGVRVTSFRYDLMDNDENLLGVLTSVEKGGSLDWSASEAIKGSGSLNISDQGQDIDWLNTRIRPVALLEGQAEVPLGVFIPSAPKEAWTATGRVWNVELLDKNSLLDQDIPTGANGVVVTYALPAGTNVIVTVKALIGLVGETAPAIMDSTAVLAAPMTWDLGTTILKVINDLLETAGYASLWCDGVGQYRTAPYVTPRQRTPVYEALQPFTRGPTSLMSPEWQRDNDIYSIPNRYVAQGMGDETTEAPVAVATNMNPNSPYSYQARGDRWITRTVTGVEAVDNAALLTRAQMGLSAASSVTSGISLDHLFLPDLHVNEVIAFRHNVAGLDLLCYVTNTTVPLDPTALCSSEIREAVL